MQPNGKCVAILLNKQCIICNSILKSQWWKTVCRAKDGSKLSIAKVAEAKNKAQLPLSDPNSDEADAGGNSSAQTRSETRKVRILLRNFALSGILMANYFFENMLRNVGGLNFRKPGHLQNIHLWLWVRYIIFISDIC